MNKSLLRLDCHKDHQIEFRIDRDSLATVITEKGMTTSYVLDPKEFEIFLSFLKLKELL